MKRILFGLLTLFWCAAPAHGSYVWQVLLVDTVALSSNCTNDTEFGLPDGTVCSILWDRNRNGRDDTLGHFEDSLALICDDPNCPYGTGRDTLNFNEFVLNGEAQGEGRGKFVCEQYLRAFGPTADPQWLPRPDSFYVRVCGDSVYWESEIFSPEPRATPYSIYLHNWRCVHRPCPTDIPPPPAVQNFRASDSTFCDGIHLRWDPYPAYGDSIFLYREGTLIAGVSARDTAFVDTTVSTLVRRQYSIQARRGSDGALSAYVFDYGTRAVAPLAVTQVVASDDSCGRVRICWHYQTNAGVDSFAIFRNGVEIQKVMRGEPGTQCWTYHTDDPTQAEYCVASWNRFCGYSSITDPGSCDNSPPPPALIQMRYIPSGGHCLGAPCDTISATPFADGTPLWFCWDNNANGPDSVDQQLVQIGFNGVAEGYGMGYFSLPMFVIRSVPSHPDTALYYQKVNSNGVCWTTSDFLVQPGLQTVNFTWSQWTCEDHPCGADSIPGIAGNVSTSGGNCSGLTISWSRTWGALGYRIWRTPADSLTPATLIAIIYDPHSQFVYSGGECGVSYRFYVTAYNPVGAAPDSLYGVGTRFTRPEPPVLVVASDGQYDDHVRVSWPPVGGSCLVLMYVIQRNGSALDSVLTTSATFDDTTAVPGVVYAYAVRSVNLCGRSAPSPADSGFRRLPDSAQDKPALPTRTALRECYPNPFNATTTIVFDLARAERVRVAMYDLMGREVAVLAEGMSSTGSYSVVFDGSQLSSGVYFCRMDAGKFVGQQKLLLLK